MYVFGLQYIFGGFNPLGFRPVFQLLIIGGFGNIGPNKVRALGF